LIPFIGPFDAKTAMGWVKLSAKLCHIKINPWLAFSELFILFSISLPLSSSPVYIKVRLLTLMLSLKKT